MSVPNAQNAVDNGATAPLSWRCFHCDAVFTDREGARLHFGTTEMQRPACTIDVAEYRRMEEINARHCAEDTDLHRQIYSLENQHAQALRREEEKGYARGLADANAARAFLADLVAARWDVPSVAELSEISILTPGANPRLNGAYNLALMHLRGCLVEPPAPAAS